MNVMTKTYICFHCHNNEIEEYEVSSRNAAITDIPVTAYAYKFYDRIVIEAPNGELCYGFEKNESPITYIDCISMTTDDLKQLLAQMDENCDKAVVITPWGEVHSCETDAKLVSRFELEEKL